MSILSVFGRLLLPGLGLLLTHQPVLAQTPGQSSTGGCIFSANCVAGPAATAPLSSDYVTVTLADSLGEDRAAVEAVLQANPQIRIDPTGKEAEYLVARYPDYPDTLILVSKPYRGIFALPDAPQFPTDEAIAGMYQMLAEHPMPDPNGFPPVIGNLLDGTLASELNDEIQHILWARRLLQLKAGQQPADVSSTPSTEMAYRCIPEDSTSNCGYPRSLIVHNNAMSARHVAIIRIDGRNRRALLATDAPGQQAMVAPTASVVFREVELSSAVFAVDRYVTISSPAPIDLSLLDSRDGKMASLPEDWALAIYVPPPSQLQAGGGGFIAGPLTAPWQVQLYSTDSSTPKSLLANAVLGRVDWALYEKTHRCGGTLIETNIVLTAAHCVANSPFAGPTERQTALKYRRVKLATQNLRFGGTTYAIEAIVVHGGYVPGQTANDIALLKIKPDSSTVPHIAAKRRTTALASRPVRANDRVSWYGWGVMEEVAGRNTRLTSAGGAQRNPADLRTGEMQILDRKKCRALEGYAKVDEFMLCAVTPPNSRAAREGRHVFTCLGDSGGPVMGKENGKTVQVGIVSWAVGCGANDNPSVSVNVHRYLGWISLAKSKFVTGRSVEFEQ